MATYCSTAISRRRGDYHAVVDIFDNVVLAYYRKNL